MVLRLRIVDQPATADAGLKPEFDVLTSGSFVLGRNKECDWVLRDDRLDISMKHCEIRAEEAGFTLSDISTNGVFLNKSPARLGAPHKLADGDVFSVGRFVIRASIDGIPIADAPSASSATSSEPRTKVGGRNSDPAAAAFDVGRLPTSTRSLEGGETGMTFIAPADKRPTVAVSPTPRPRPAEPPVPVSPSAPDVQQATAVSAPAPSPPIEPPTSTAPSPSLARLAAGLGLTPDALSTSDAADTLFRVGQLTRQLAEVIAALQAEHRRALRALGSRRIALPLNSRLGAASFADNVPRALTDLLTGPAQPDQAVTEAGAALVAHQKALMASAIDAATQMATALDPKALGGGDTHETHDRKARLWDTYATTWRGIDPDWSTGFLEAYRVMLGAAYDDASSGAAKAPGEGRS
jgi:type VI secretion system FHA domain protein